MWVNYVFKGREKVRLPWRKGLPLGKGFPSRTPFKKRKRWDSLELRLLYSERVFGECGRLPWVYICTQGICAPWEVLSWNYCTQENVWGPFWVEDLYSRECVRPSLSWKLVLKRMWEALFELKTCTQENVWGPFWVETCTQESVWGPLWVENLYSRECVRPFLRQWDFLAFTVWITGDQSAIEPVHL